MPEGRFFVVSQYLAEEVLQAGIPGVVEEVGRCALLQNFAVGYEHHTVGHLPGEAHLG